MFHPCEGIEGLRNVHHIQFILVIGGIPVDHEILYAAVRVPVGGPDCQLEFLILFDTIRRVVYSPHHGGLVHECGKLLGFTRNLPVRRIASDQKVLEPGGYRVVAHVFPVQVYLKRRSVVVPFIHGLCLFVALLERIGDIQGYHEMLVVILYKESPSPLGYVRFWGHQDHGSGILGLLIVHLLYAYLQRVWYVPHEIILGCLCGLPIEGESDLVCPVLHRELRVGHADPGLVIPDLDVRGVDIIPLEYDLQLPGPVNLLCTAADCKDLHIDSLIVVIRTEIFLNAEDADLLHGRSPEQIESEPEKYYHDDDDGDDRARRQSSGHFLIIFRVFLLRVPFSFEFHVITDAG